MTKPKKPAATPGTDVVKAEARAATTDAEHLLETVRTFEIRTRDDLALAGEALMDVKGRARRLKTRQDEITKPLNQALAATRALFRPALSLLDDVERAIKAQVGAFAAEEHARNSAAVTRAADAHAEGDARGVEEALAEVASVKDVEGITTYQRWRFVVEDETLLPREFLTPNLTLLGEHAKHTTKGSEPTPVPGVRFFPETVVAARAS